MSVLKSQGVTFEVQNAAAAYIEVGQVRDIGGPSGQAPVIDATHLGSTRREKIMGLPDEGQVTLSCFYDPADVGQMRLRALRDSQEEGAFRITLTDGGAEEQTFAGYVIGKNQSINTDDATRVDFTIEVTGEVAHA